MTEVAPVAGVSAITYHAWNADRSLVALSPNTNEVWIYGAKGDDASKWEKKWTLDEHAGQVSGIDWCPTTNLIVTCGHDRNAYVWKVSTRHAHTQKQKQTSIASKQAMRSGQQQARAGHNSADRSGFDAHCGSSASPSLLPPAVCSSRRLRRNGVYAREDESVDERAEAQCSAASGTRALSDSA